MGEKEAYQLAQNLVLMVTVQKPFLSALISTDPDA